MSDRCARCEAAGVANPPAATVTVTGFDGAKQNVCAECATTHERIRDDAHAKWTAMARDIPPAVKVTL